MPRLAILEGYGSPFGGTSRKRKKKLSKKQLTHQKRFARASKACKGLSPSRRAVCMRKKLKK